MKGKKALVTGGTSGIGLATARLLLAAGAEVVIAGRSAARGKYALDSLKADGKRRAYYLAADVTDSAACRRLVEESLDRLGGLDILINSAGIYCENSLEDTTDEIWREVMAVNMDGTFYMCRAALAPLKKSGAGAIVNISSDAGLHGNFFCTAYCAAKGAVAMFTKALALEAAPYNVRVNCLCPGDILTPMTEEQLKKFPDREAALNEMANLYPLKRIGTAEEAAQVALFLASPAASFVTGALWSADGGLTA